jgi:ABC-type amino acid transport substrate-binding protein
MRVTWRLPAAILALVIVAAACGSTTPNPSSAPGVSTSVLDDIQERGTLRVGAECLYKGTCFLDPATGERMGYGVDLTNMLAADLGVEVEWTDVEWTALIPSLQTGKIDMVSQGMTKTPERLLSVYMSDPMEFYPQALVLNASDPLNQNDDLDAVIAELNKPDKTITFLLGGAHQVLVENFFPEAQHKGLESAQAFEEVATGRANAMIVDTGDAWDYQANNPDAVIWQSRPISQSVGSFVVPYGDQRFLDYLNGWIEYYRSNGTLRNLKLQWNAERGIPAELAGVLPGN